RAHLGHERAVRLAHAAATPVAARPRLMAVTAELAAVGVTHLVHVLHSASDAVIVRVRRALRQQVANLRALLAVAVLLVVAGTVRLDAVAVFVAEGGRAALVAAGAGFAARAVRVGTAAVGRART